MSSPPFTFFVSLLREISCSDSPPLRVFGRWVSRLRADFPQLAEGSTVTLFRLLFPEDDSRRKYDMQEARLASAIADCLGTSAKPLRAWATATSGCLGAEVLTVMQRCSLNVEFSPLTMANVDQLLDELAANSGFTCASIRKDYPIATRRNKETILRALYRCLAPLDAAWLTQILLKDLRPMLYPLSATHYSRALKAYNSVSVAELSKVRQIYRGYFDVQLDKEEAMKVWDPSGRLLHCYRVRSRIDDAASAFEAGGPLSFNPQIGQPVPIPKARKGRGCEDALAPLRSSKEIWAETKYDGERAQIHVELCGQRTPRITIFSKSLRDSTWDRYGIHALILEALALQPGSETSSVTSNIILDAEMVAWHGDKIDEFWRIHSLVEHTARSARKTILIETDEIYTQDSLKTDVSERHLGLVFFDILLLNSTSLLSTPYSSRRSLLESVIRPLPTRAMLANRTNIVLEDNSLGVTIESTLASSIASGEEGLMLKAAEGRYNDHRYPCVKLKADYIRGYGDSLDFVLLAVGWDKERARLLRVSTDCFTTFYFGALRNEAELEKDPSARPHFYLFFTSSYGLSRDELEETNFFLKSTESVPFSATHPSSQSLRFTFTILRGLTPPSRILVNPLLCELLGAGFTKSPKSRSYELRFPRIAKLFRPHQRHWNEGVTLNALHLIARESMSRDRSDKDLDDWGNAAWNKPVSPAAAQKRKATTEKWHDKLISHPKNRRRKSLHSEFTMRTIAPLTTTSRANVEVPRATHIVVAMTEDAPGSRPVDALPSSMQSAAVFLATRNKKLRRHWQRITPAHNIVHSLESLFQACGWVEEDVSSSTSSPSVRRGIILLAVDEQLAHREDLVSAMQERKLLCAGRPHLKSIWLLEKDSHDSA